MIHNADNYLRIIQLAFDLHLTAGWREFYCVMQYVTKSLDETIAIAFDDQSGCFRRKVKLKFDQRVAGIGSQVLNRFRQDSCQRNRACFKAHLAAQNSRHIKQVIYQVLETVSISIHYRKRLSKFGLAQGTVLHY